MTSKVNLFGWTLVVADADYPQYSGTFHLSRDQAEAVRVAANCGDIEAVRDWMDDHADKLRRLPLKPC